MRNKLFMLLGIIIAVVLTVGNAFAYSYTPQPSDFQGLWHTRYYYWDINDPSLRGETITGAELTIRNVYNATPDPSNVLYITLLDNAPMQTPGGVLGTSSLYGATQTVTWYEETTDNTVNAFEGQGPVIGQWHDTNYGLPGVDLVFTLDASQLNALISNAADNHFGIGIDPDCLFINDGFTLTITTVPEPASLLLFGSGLVGLSFYARQRRSLLRKK